MEQEQAFTKSIRVTPEILKRVKYATMDNALTISQACHIVLDQYLPQLPAALRSKKKGATK
jgi:hypothetical protein